MVKIVIIGAGWYGLYLAKKMVEDKATEKNVDITILEKNTEIFGNMSASRYNQCRLHLGFHYPRSHSTRVLCKKGYTRFLGEFGDLTFDIPKNFYVISDSSILDYESYAAIFLHEGYEYKIDSTQSFLQKVDSRAFVVEEKGIDPIKAKKYFEILLTNKVKFLFGCTVTDLTDNNQLKYYDCNSKQTCIESFDVCYDCSNFQAPIGNEISPLVMFERTITLLYHCRIQHFGALTIMDGPFFSIFPYDKENNIYSLTHVKHTVVNEQDAIDTIRMNMEKDVVLYYPSFLDDFTFVGHFMSPKTKPISSRSDSRHLIIYKVNDNIFRISCGKITGIFQMVDELLINDY